MKRPIMKSWSGIFMLVLTWTWSFLLTACIQPLHSPPADHAQGWPDLVDGIRLYEEGNYSEAAERFIRIIESYPGSPLLKESEWLLTKSYLGRGEKTAAIRELNSFLRNYPNSNHEEEARALLSRLQSHKKTLAAYWFPTPDKILADEIPVLLKKGINALIIPVYDNTPGRAGVYFMGAGAPLLKDRLQEWILTAHLSGIRIIAKMPLREMRWERINPESRDPSFEASGKNVKNNKLDLFDPEVRERIVELYREVSRYPIDGIYVEDISYELAEGWTPSALDRYFTLFQERPDPVLLFGDPDARSGGQISFPKGAQFWRWVGWRSRFLNAFLKELQSEAQSVRPGIRFGVGIPEILLLDPQKGLAELSHDFLELKGSNFDFYLFVSKPMSPLRSSLDETLSKYGIRPDKIWFQPPVFSPEFLTGPLRSSLQGWVLLSP